LFAKNLYETVVLSNNRNVITLGDYITSGRVQGRVDAFIESTIRDVLCEVKWTRIDGQTLEKWKSVLASLVARREGGEVGTLILTEERLIEVAEAENLRGHVSDVLREMANEKWRLLRQVSVVKPSCIQVEYSLGHDAIAIPLYRWREAQSLYRVERQRVQRTTRMLVAGFVICAVMTASVLAMLAVQSFVLRRQAINTLSAYAASQPGFGIRRKTLLLLTALSKTDGIWGTLIVIVKMCEVSWSKFLPGRPPLSDNLRRLGSRLMVTEWRAWVLEGVYRSNISGRKIIKSRKLVGSPKRNELPVYRHRPQLDS
jgi:hypothetical protein